MVKIPTLEEIAFLPEAEAEAAILATIPPAYRLDIELREREIYAALVDEADNVLWDGTSSDRRVLLFDVYGYVLRTLGGPKVHPRWARSGEVNIPARFGVRAYQGDVRVPDPEDLEPEEIQRIYGILPKDGDPR